MSGASEEAKGGNQTLKLTLDDKPVLMIEKAGPAYIMSIVGVPRRIVGGQYIKALIKGLTELL